MSTSFGYSQKLYTHSLVLDIVSTVSIHRNIMHEIPMEVSIHRKKFRYIELSIHRNIGRGLLSIPWHPRVFYADTERKLTCIEHRNRVYLVSIFFFCSSVSYRTRLRCRYPTLPSTRRTDRSDRSRSSPSRPPTGSRPLRVVVWDLYRI